MGSNNHNKISKIGGTNTYRKYGREHMAELGRKSYQAKLAKYGKQYFIDLSKKAVAARMKKKHEEWDSTIEAVADCIIGK
jgi:hypothetical protein